MLIRMKVDAKQILSQARHKDKKRQVVVYISDALYTEFKQACDGVVISQVVEQLIRLFLSDAKQTHLTDSTKE